MEKFSKLKQINIGKWILPIFALVSIVTSFFVEPLITDVKMNILVDYAMDFNNNFYFINDDPNGYYSITKTDSKGYKQFSKKLQDPDSKADRTYRKLDVDSQGNIYVLYKDREISPIPDEESKVGGIKNETVAVYSSSGEFVRDLATVDFTQEGTLPQTNYIYNIQVIDQTLSIICGRGNKFEILTTHITDKDSPQVSQSFEIDPLVTSNIDLVSGIAVSSSGKVVYSTRSGEIFAMNDQKQFINVTPASSKEIVVADLSIDKNDHIFFTDMISGNYYNLTGSDLHLETLYSSDAVIDSKKNIKFEDLTHVFVSQEGQYYGKYKNAGNDKYIYFGAQNGFISNIREKLLPNRVVVFVLSSVIIFAALFLIFKIIMKCKEGMKVKTKIVASFVPLYTLAIIVLISVVINISVSSYDNYLRGEQEISGRVTLEKIDKALFAKIDPVSGYLSADYNTFDKQFGEGFLEARSVGNTPSNCIILYKMKDGKLYSFDARGYLDNDKEIAFKSATFLANPVEYSKSKESSEVYYNVWNDFISGNDEKEGKLYTTEDNYGTWMSVFQPIRDTEGNIIGMIQGSINKAESRDSFYFKTLALVILIFISVSAIIFVCYFIIIKVILNPLKEIKSSVDAIGEGIWNTKLNIKSKDEFYDIGRAFNLMTDRMNQYISNLVVLNKEYMKFVPMELIYLLGKRQITDIKLNDRNKILINVIYLSFDNGYHKVYKSISEDRYFDMLNKNFDLLFTVVERNNGVIQWFDGLGMVALFPNSSEDAVRASMQFKEVFANNDFGSYMKILLGKGSAVVGVTGNDKRYNISVVSDEIMNMDYLIKHLSEANVKHFALEPIIKGLGKNTNYNYRFIGHIKSMYSDQSVRLYEFIDNIRLHEKNLYISTKPLFEKAVELYIKGSFAEARKLFTSVIRINEEDKLAMYYLILCDKNADKNIADWEGYL